MALVPAERIARVGNYIWLLLVLLLLSFFSAIAAQFDLDVLRMVASSCMAIVILVAVWSSQRNQYPFTSKIAVTLVIVFVEGGGLVLDHYHLGTVQLLLFLLFILATIVLACRQVLFTGSVGTNEVVGSICIFLLLGLAWAVAYLLVERLFPGSLPELAGAHWRDHLHESIYFSFVTLTSVGYGDISPAQPLAHFLAYLQGITGQFYLAIVVASLIGAKMSDDARGSAQ